MARDVGECLEGLGLGMYAEAFDQNAVDFRALPHLDEDDLKELGVSFGHHKKLLKASSRIGCGAVRGTRACHGSNRPFAR